MIASSVTLTTLLALAAWFLGLSLLVQIVQELYKLLTSSKSRAYAAALTDFAGPFARQLLESNIAPELTVRGPFQFRRRQPLGRLLPLKKETLVTALERTAPMWYRLTREALELEAQLRPSWREQPVSTTFRSFLERLARGSEEEPGQFDAREMASFLGQRGLLESKWVELDFVPSRAYLSEHKADQQATKPYKAPQKSSVIKFAVPESLKPFDALELLTEFRLKYSPQIVRVEQHYDQLMENYEYAYRRRNLRQSFVLALLLALWCDFAFDAIYSRAAASTEQEAHAAAERAIQLYAAQQPAVASASSAKVANPGSVQSGATPSSSSTSGTQPVQISYLPQTRLRNALKEIGSVFRHPAGGNVMRQLGDISYYLFGCILTAILICFGAPFWNDLTKSLLRISQGGSKAKNQEDK